MHVDVVAARSSSLSCLSKLSVVGLAVALSACGSPPSSPAGSTSGSSGGGPGTAAAAPATGPMGFFVTSTGSGKGADFGGLAGADAH